jgi:hypothetical protein
LTQRNITFYCCLNDANEINHPILSGTKQSDMVITVALGLWQYKDMQRLNLHNNTVWQKFINHLASTLA